MPTPILRLSAFTDSPSGGNPAGVVLDAGHLSAAEMLHIAADVGYSETAFIVDADDRRRNYRVRYFSPRAEVAFCGHATIATAVALADRAGPGSLVFETQAGKIRVDVGVDGGRTTATITSVPTRSRPALEDEVAPALAALRWSRADLDADFPPHVAFAGVEHLMLGAATRERLAHLDYDFAALLELMAERQWTTLHLFWREREDLFHARDPFPVGGVVEDPATGAAAAAFGGYLRALGRVPPKRRLLILQGEDMGRPSQITVDIQPGGARVRVSGGAVPLAAAPSVEAAPFAGESRLA